MLIKFHLVNAIFCGGKYRLIFLFKFSNYYFLCIFARFFKIEKKKVCQSLDNIILI
jgi:hypothetical protein